MNQTPVAETLEVPGSSRLSRLVKRIAPVRREEVATVALLTINVFVLLSCYYVLKVVREPLILLGGGAELKAYASAGQTLLLLAVVPAFGLLVNKFSRMKLMTVIQLFFAGCLVAFYLLAQARAPIGLAFYLWLGIFNVLVVSNFWSFANDLYTEEQGKRLFGLIGIGASIGAILGAFVPHLLHKLIGTEQLMLVAAGGLVVSTVLYRVVDRREGHAVAKPVAKVGAPKTDESKEPKESKRGGFALVMKDRYLRLIAAMLLVATIINTTGEYVIGKMAEDASATLATHAAQEAYLSNFYSSYYTVVNLVAALLQGFVVAWVLTKIGIRRALFIMPLVVLGGWIALIAFTSMTMIRIEKTTENSLDYSLHTTLRQALFLPTAREAKYKAKVAIDTFFFRMGDMVAGIGLVFILVHEMGLGVRAFAILNTILAATWVFLAARAGRLHDERVAQHVGDEPAKPEEAAARA